MKLNPKLAKACQQNVISTDTKTNNRQLTVKFNLSSETPEKQPTDTSSDEKQMIRSHESSKDEYSFSSFFAQETGDNNDKDSLGFNTKYDNEWELSIGHFQLPQAKLDIEIVTDQNGQNVTKEFQKFQKKISNHIRDIVKNLRYLQNLHHMREINQLIEIEWRAVGLVVDRLFFFCYIFIIVYSMASYFPRDEKSKFKTAELDFA